VPLTVLCSALRPGSVRFVTTRTPAVAGNGIAGHAVWSAILLEQTGLTGLDWFMVWCGVAGGVGPATWHGFAPVLVIVIKNQVWLGDPLL
jgi:hypothetical protein